MAFTIRFNTVFRVGCLLLLAILLRYYYLNTFKTWQKAAVVGRWQNTYIKVVLHTPNDTLAEVFCADSLNWQQKLHIKPIITFFNADGTYYSEYRNLSNTLLRKPFGTWKITADSMVLTQAWPKKVVYKFKFDICDSMLILTGLVDFDDDGTPNDVYYGRQIRYKVTKMLRPALSCL
jgi:hypothetical protein